MKRSQRCGSSGIPSGHGSKLERWFAARTKPPCGSRASPRASSRKTPFTTGYETIPMNRYIGEGRDAIRRIFAPPATLVPVSKRLVIVESPAKARTIKGFLGPEFEVESSIGHIRDLPERAADVPAEYKKEKWARLGVNVDNDFEPLYVVDTEKKKRVADLKKLLKDADELLLATDEDREGEAIAWHLHQVLKPKVPTRRMVFHEITRDAIARALEQPRDIDERLVDAQETRRILDRLYGYEVSPVLWKKIMPRLSAGRVQSVATRLVVEKERERMAFRSASYWDLDAILDAGPEAEPPLFPARLTRVGERRAAQGRDFDSRGSLITKDHDQLVRLDEDQARALAASLRSAAFAVDGVESKPYTRRPYAPFRTTTLQQEAGRKLGFSTQRTMSVAQDLYEAGFITYMRTDSVTLSGAALAAARQQVRQLFGVDYLPDKPRTYTSKVKNAQEAHEAIRPAGETFLTPARTRLTGDQFRLYELIWMRTIASQMKDAEGFSITVNINAQPSAGEPCTFVASGRTTTSSLYRALAGCQARRVGDRPAVHVRDDHPHHHRPGLCVQEGYGASPDLARLCGHPVAGAALPEAGGLHLHGRDGRRLGRDRRRPCRAAQGADRLLLRR